MVLRADGGASAAGVGASTVIHGAEQVAIQALSFARFARFARHALVNGAAGLVNVVEGRPRFDKTRDMR